MAPVLTKVSLYSLSHPVLLFTVLVAHHEDTGLNDEANTDVATHSNSLEGMPMLCVEAVMLTLSAAPGGVEDRQAPSSDVHSHDATTTSRFLLTSRL